MFFGIVPRYLEIVLRTNRWNDWWSFSSLLGTEPLKKLRLRSRGLGLGRRRVFQVHGPSARRNILDDRRSNAIIILPVTLARAIHLRIPRATVVSVARFAKRRENSRREKFRQFPLNNTSMARLRPSWNFLAAANPSEGQPRLAMGPRRVFDTPPDTFTFEIDTRASNRPVECLRTISDSRHTTIVSIPINYIEFDTTRYPHVGVYATRSDGASPETLKDAGRNDGINFNPGRNLFARDR